MVLLHKQHNYYVATSFAKCVIETLNSNLKFVSYTMPPPLDFLFWYTAFMKKDSEQAFAEAYARLNDAQREAVDVLEGPVMVVAGPGTGKTQILTLRIANILRQTDTQPEHILALTFTESGAQAMRARLRQYIGTDAYRVAIHTFHGFAGRLIKEYPDAYPHIIGAEPMTEINKIELIESILEAEEISLLRPIGNPAYYVPHILRTLSTLKQEYITPDAFRDYIVTQEEALAQIPKVHEKGAHKGKVRGEYQKQEKAIAKNHELLFVYRRYHALARERRLYDFDDMIVETVGALETGSDMLLDLQEQYQYLLADEHQDVNGSQNKILELLASYHASPNLFVVGDEKQAIYRFQGASLENFLYFGDAFTGTHTISLTENYRSGQAILDAAHSLIEDPEGPAAALRIPLTAAAVPSSQIALGEFSHQHIEDAYVVDRIASLVDEGVSGAAIAVIVRTNRDVERFATLLRKKGIAAHASADGDILQHPIMAAVHDLLQVVTDASTDAALFRSLHAPYWGLSNKDMMTLLSARSYSCSLMELIGDTQTLASLGIEDVDAVQRIAHIIAHARTREVVDAPHTVLEYLLTESGFLRHVMQESPHEGARVIRRIYDEVEEMARTAQGGVLTLSAVVAVFARLRAHTIPLKAPYLSVASDAVQVMTAHKSKGLEFAHVFVPHVVDSTWGGARKATYFDIPVTKHIAADAFDAIDDERRLLYVAMTRAQVSLCITYAHTNAEGREGIASRLLSDIEDERFSVLDTAAFESSFDLTDDLAGAVKKHHIDAAFLKQQLIERGLSATALNNYLDSPWNYLYRNVLRIPEVQALPLMYGTAVHAVLEYATKHRVQHDELPSTSAMATKLHDALGALPLTKHEHTQLHEKGLVALTAYTDTLQSGLPQETKEEYKLRVLFETGESDIPEIPLTGMFDRLDFDAAGKLLRVVDYKTGKPKTRNDIEGKTKTSNGHYKRQLVFYALLLELYDDERYATRTMTLSFVEPDSNGKIHEETFVITDEEIAALKEDMLSVVRAIKNGTFLDVPCDASVCDYCALVQAL